MSNSEFVSMAGSWKARAVEWGFDKINDKERINIIFEILEGPHQGRHLTWRGYFTPAAIERTFESLRYCGWDGDDIATVDKLGLNEISLQVKDEVFTNDQGQEQWINKAAFVNKLRGLDLENQLNPAELRSFADRVRGAAIASRQKAAGQQAAPAARPSPLGRPLATPARTASPLNTRTQSSFDDGRASGDPGPSDADVGF